MSVRVQELKRLHKWSQEPEVFLQDLFYLLPEMLCFAKLELLVFLSGHLHRFLREFFRQLKLVFSHIITDDIPEYLQ